MSDFDELLDTIKCTDSIHEIVLKSWNYRQSEIDELRKKYDAMYNAFTYSDDCRKEWHESFMRSKAREDELLNRIDEALDMLEGRKGKVLLDDIVDTLKGTTNDH